MVWILVSCLWSDCENLQCVGGDDDSGDGYLSHGSFYAYTGNTYLIAWDDRWGTEEFEFTLEENDPPPPPPFEFTAINVNSVGSERGLVDMTGDGLDDLVSIQSSNVNLLVQTEGGFEEINISTDQQTTHHHGVWPLQILTETDILIFYMVEVVVLPS